jgi:hypothetical protein
MDLVAPASEGQDALLVTAEGQPLEEQGVDLPLQFARGPAGVDRLDLVESAGLGLVHAQEQAVVSPGQFSTHRVEFWVGQVEVAHVPEVGAVETLAEVGAEAFGKGFHEALAVAGALLPVLLLLDDDLADVPVGGDHRLVDGPPGLVAGLGQDAADALVRPVDVGGGPGFGGEGLFLAGSPSRGHGSGSLLRLASTVTSSGHGGQGTGPGLPLLVLAGRLGPWFVPPPSPPDGRHHVGHSLPVDRRQGRSVSELFSLEMRTDTDSARVQRRQDLRRPPEARIAADRFPIRKRFTVSSRPAAKRSIR